MVKNIIVILMALTGCTGKTTGDKVADSMAISKDSVLTPTATDVTSSFEIESNGFIYMPYDFPLDADSIKARLGKNAIVKVDEFEAGDDYGAYSITTVSDGGEKISFYSFAGKHSAEIYSNRLPLQRGIVVGMSRDDFVKTFSITGNGADASVYLMVDNFGSIRFSFDKDKLAGISVYYEEGD